METKRKLEEIERVRQEDEDRRAALDLQVNTFIHVYASTLHTIIPIVIKFPGPN